MSQIWVLGSHFSRLLVTVDFDDGSFKKYGQFIIQGFGVFIQMAHVIKWRDSANVR